MKLQWLKNLRQRVFGGVKRILGDDERQYLAEVGVLFVVRAADPDITEAELDELERRSLKAIRDARNQKAVAL